MATVTPPRTTRNLQQDQIRVRSPLARLRKYIHTYVGLEGTALVILFVALYFWIGLGLDYGFFKLFLVDWVQTLPWGFRAGVLGVIVLALVVLLLSTVLFRLLHQFSDAAMALVLERRFPTVLGDRLITAVELSDPQEAAALGYSPDLLKETIHEAADRVDQVPVGEVFDWKRLVRRGVSLVLLTVGMYLLAAAGFCAARSIRGEGTPMAGVGDFNDVATIWVERNILLRNTIWPRRSYLEILPWPRKEGLDEEEAQNLEPGELRIPQGTTPPALRVRAWKYIVADPDAPEGWRLLKWEDLKDRPDFANNADIPDLPKTWQPRDAEYGMTLDEVELLIEEFPLRSSEQAKWSVASASEESGSRPLMWADLTKEKLAGLDVPGIPGDWDPKAMPALIAGGAGLVKPGPFSVAARIVLGPKYISLSVDEVEKKLEEAERRAKENKPGRAVAGQEVKVDGKQPTSDKAIAEVRAVIDRLKQLASIRDVIDQVGEKASERDMRRVMRKLIVPSTVTLTYSSTRSTSTSSMIRIAGNEFTGNFSELKESVTFTVRGEDYITPRQKITVVERPRIDVLESEEERPAYLYYRPATDGTAAELRGKRQPLTAVKLSVSGETTTMEVPVGTNITLRGTLSKPLRSITVEVEPRDKKNFIGSEPKEVDERVFEMRLNNVRREQRFKLIFEDTDRVVGERKIVINAKEDFTPRVREFNPDELIRRGRGNEGFIISANCRIPFKGRVLDDHGLARVRYACRVIPADFLSETKIRTLFGVAAAPLMAPVPGSTMLLGIGYMTALNRELSSAAKDEAGPDQHIDLPAFTQAVAAGRLSDGRSELIDRATILSLLETKQKEPFRKLRREFNLSPDRWLEAWAENDDDMRNPNRWYRANDARSPIGCDLPLWRLTWRDKDGRDRPLKDPDDTKPQKRFLIEVRLLVDDTYIDGEIDPKTKQPIPHTSPSGETFTFVVVPENELLSRIAEEEEAKYRELQKAFKPLPENQPRLADIHASLAGAGVDEKILNSYVARCDSLVDVLKTSHQDTTGVYKTYERIIREMRANQIREDIMTRVFKTIYLPLQQVSDRQFDRTYEAVRALRRAMDAPSQPIDERIAAARTRADQARNELNELVTQINAILAAMEGITKINELITELARIEKQEEDLESLVKRILMRRIKEELQPMD